jgi:hypothetical protein
MPNTGTVTKLAKMLPRRMWLGQTLVHICLSKSSEILPLSCSSSQHNDISEAEQGDVLWNVQIVKISADCIMAESKSDLA